MEIANKPDGGAHSPAKLGQGLVAIIENVSRFNGEIGTGFETWDLLLFDLGFGRKLQAGAMERSAGLAPQR